MTLLNYRSNIYSQNGEDGVISELLRRLEMTGDGDRWCVEFGAWDGRHLSNTFNLVESRRWSAVYIEGDPEKYRDLESTARKFPRIRPILGMVGGEGRGGSALDHLLAGTDIPNDYDLLSVDIDSCDLDVWARHVDFRPSIVVIEINSSIEPGILQWHSEGAQGNSFSATVHVAVAKGYTLVCHTGNLIFVKNELADLVGLDELDRRYPERLFLWNWVPRGGSGFVSTRMVSVGSKLPDPLKRPIRKVFGR